MIYISKVLPVYAVLAVLILVNDVSVAQAQVESTTKGSALEEIVVTARKRSESLQDTPIAVSAFNAADLEQRSLTNLIEVTSFAPNVSANSVSRGAGASNAGVYIRGVGQNDFLFTTDPGVGIYVDGVYFPRTIGGVMDLLDFERVEILRGPQGTLFGKNTIGGAINVVSAKPDGKNGGYAQVTAGNFNRVDARGSFDFPVIADKLFGKVSFSTKNRDGHSNRLDFPSGEILEKGVGDEDQTAVRAALRWLPSEDTTVDFSMDYTTQKQSGKPVTMTAIVPTGKLAQLWNLTVGGPAGTVYDDRYLIPGNVDDSYATGPNINNFEGWGVHLTIEQDLGWATARSVTAYREFNAHFGFDADGSPLEIASTEDRQKQDQISQEIQLFGEAFDDKLRWQTGLFYFNEYGQDINEVILSEGLYQGLEGLPGPVDGSPLALPTAPGGPGNPINIYFDLLLDIFNDIDITSMAAYAQTIYDITDRLSVTAGARYTYEEKEYYLNMIRGASGVPAVDKSRARESWNEMTPMGSIQFKLTDDLMTYATISKGFKSGGFNGRVIEQAAIESFEPEGLTSYEIGLKSEWLDRRLRINAAAFYMDYTDLQVNAISFSEKTGSLVLRTDNIADAEVKGVEVEMRALLMDNLDLGVNLGYLDFEIVNLDPTVVGITLDTQNVRTPEWTGSAYGQYTWPWKDYGEFTLRGDWSYESDSFSDIENTALAVRQAHSIFNARLNFDMPQNGWTLSIFGTNLSNKRVIDNGVQDTAASGFIYGSYNRPREWGVTIKKTF